MANKNSKVTVDSLAADLSNVKEMLNQLLTTKTEVYTKVKARKQEKRGRPIRSKTGEKGNYRSVTTNLTATEFARLEKARGTTNRSKYIRLCLGFDT